MATHSPKPETQQEETGENAERVPVAERTYAVYTANRELGFDPMRELNLPASYAEAVRRFKRLQGEHAPDALN
jgi:hypothetical protein